MVQTRWARDPLWDTEGWAAGGGDSKLRTAMPLKGLAPSPAQGGATTAGEHSRPNEGRAGQLKLQGGSRVKG